MSIGGLKGTVGKLSSGHIPDPRRPPNSAYVGVEEKSNFQIAAKGLENDENVNRVRLIRHLPALNNRTTCIVTKHDICGDNVP